MRKYIAVVLVALSLGGCATIQRIQTLTELGTVSVANPITRERLAQIESAATLVFVGLNTWKRTCRAGLIPQECRRHIRTVQVYTLQMPSYLLQLRTFVRQNDQVNATVVFGQLTEIIATVRAKAAESGQNLGA